MTRTNGRPRLRRPPKADAAIYDGLAQRFRAGALYSFNYDHDGRFWTTFATEHNFDATERNGRYRCSCAPQCGFGPTDWLDRAELVTWLGLDEAPKVTRKRQATSTTDVNGGSELVAALEGAYGEIRRHHPELPDVVMITGSGMDSYGLRWGHFARDRWIDALNEGRRPLFVGGERLACGAELTFQTMLHESVHAIACVRGVQDCSRQNRYHNRRFLELAGEIGLEYVHGTPDTTIGYSAVELTDATRKRYRTVIACLERAVRLHLDNPLATVGTGTTGTLGGHGGRIKGGRKRTRGTGGASLVKAVCACFRIVRVSRSTLDAGAITCGLCGEEFAA